jgi:predicted HTH transcriptional regulator
MQNLISRATPHVVRRRFNGVDNLKKELFASLVQYLCDKKILSFTPFDESVCSGATLSDISDEKIAWFVPLARKERKFPLPIGTPTEKVLTHLDLLSEKHPTNAAILLFGIKPEKFFPNAETKCMHYHGTVMAKPIPSYQVFAGTLFDQADNATDFVLSKINRLVPPRDVTPTSETRYEIPKEVIQEAIVNAIAHRDYTSDAGVQVSVFSDRIEIRNPGNLPPDLTFEDLKIKHNSRPRNHRIAHPLFLTHYIEAIGYGTLQMIEGCKDAGLPEPEFAQSSGEFVVTLWRDWLTEKYLVRLNLNERQLKVIDYLKTKQQITNLEYRDMTAATPKTAGRDLDDLVKKEILELKGKGRGAHYVIVKKGKAGKPTPSREPDENRNK